jgi:hypothetical protein
MTGQTVEFVPDPGADGPTTRAALAALLSEGLLDDRRPGAYDSAWRQAAIEDGVSDGPSRVAAALQASDAPASAYVPPARSSRGATRA